MTSASVPLPPLSANSLFHFTNRLDNLVNILKQEFRPRFCLEDFSLLFPPRPDDKGEWAVPMVCFCDLPLSQTGFHLSVYGDYGIGLTKEWGKRNGISPVLYAYPGSILTTKFSAMLRAASEADTSDEGPGLLNDFYDLMCFVKPYEGDLWREERVIPNVRFYNERE